MPIKTECEECGKDVGRFKFLKKISGKRICIQCNSKRRKEKRKEIINNNPELKKEIRELENKEQRERNARKRETKKDRKSETEKIIPVPKGSNILTKKQRSNCYMTLQDKQIALRLLMGRGLDFDEAKERIAEIIKEQSRIREKMRKEGKSEEEVNIKQKEMLEELWNT